MPTRLEIALVSGIAIIATFVIGAMAYLIHPANPSIPLFIFFLLFAILVSVKGAYTFGEWKTYTDALKTQIAERNTELEKRNHSWVRFTNIPEGYHVLLNDKRHKGYRQPIFSNSVNYIVAEGQITVTLVDKRGVTQAWGQFEYEPATIFYIWFVSPENNGGKWKITRSGGH